MRKLLLSFVFALSVFCVASFAASPIIEQPSASAKKVSDLSDNATTTVVDIAPAINEETRYGNYPSRCTATVERLDVNRNEMRIPTAPAQTVDHVPIDGY